MAVATQIDTSVDQDSFFSEGSPPSEAARFLRERFGGDLFIQIHVEGDMTDPESLRTLQRLSDFMAQETGLRLSVEGVRLVLKAHDIVLSRPQHKITSPDPEYMVKKRRLKPKETI